MSEKENKRKKYTLAFAVCCDYSVIGVCICMCYVFCCCIHIILCIPNIEHSKSKYFSTSPHWHGINFHIYYIFMEMPYIWIYEIGTLTNILLFTNRKYSTGKNIHICSTNDQFEQKKNRRKNMLRKEMFV